MIYDVILGETLPTKYNYNYVKPIVFNRIEKDEITDYKGLLDVFCDTLTDSLASAMQISNVAENISIEFNSLKARIDSGEEIADIDSKIRELLSALAYIGLDVYLIRREDLDSPIVDDVDSTRAYMIDKHDSYFPKLNRVVNGKSLVFDASKEAAISTVVMQFLKDFEFEDIVEDAVKLEQYREQYEKLETQHMGWALDTDQLISFLDDYGYKFVVVA